MPVQSTFLSPKTAVPRPLLPLDQANPLLKATVDVTKPLAVKYQVITREGTEIIVGRIKVPTPAGHAFVLRRFDTGAISLTTMFRAAFPDASEDNEKQESAWVRSNYETSGANGGGGKALRLAGTWIPVTLAMHLAPSYALAGIIAPLASAIPEGANQYRKSTRTPNTTSHISPPPISPAAPNKRRKESSPTPVSAPSLSVPRTTRSKSKSPGPIRTPFKASTLTPRTPIRDQVQSVMLSPTSNASDADDAPDILGPDIQEDLNAQRELISSLKAQRDQEEVAKRAAGVMDSTPSITRKRPHADTPPLVLELEKATPEEIAARPVITRKRVMAPNHKAAAWGALAFTVGLGASTLLPSFFF